MSDVTEEGRMADGSAEIEARLQARTGRSAEEWVADIAAYGLVRRDEIVAWLTGGMGLDDDLAHMLARRASG